MKVLLATDGSQHAEEAAWLLAHLPHSERLELTVLTVSYTPEFHGSVEVVDWMQKNAEAERQRAADAFDRIKEMFEGANASLELVVKEGHVAETIVKQATDRRCDLVVLGALGHSMLDRILLGSVSDFVATHSPCSVLVVRPTGLRGQDHHDLKICFAYDDSPPSAFAVSELGKFGWGGHTKMDVVNVVSFLYAYADTYPIDIDTLAIKKALLDVVEGAAQRLKKLTPNVTPHVIEANHIGDGLVQYAKDQKSDLIVMGDTGRGMLGRFLLGSISRYILRHAPCSVWVARKPSDA